MHPNPIFHKTDAAHSLAFARERSFGTLAINADAAPFFAHIPFLLSEDARFADLHLVRSNPISRALKEHTQPARLAVTASDSYISPALEHRQNERRGHGKDDACDCTSAFAY